MKTVLVLLAIFLCIGLFTRTYTKWTRLLLLGAIVAMLVFLYVT
jgi:hypothetical protein